MTVNQTLDAGSTLTINANKTLVVNLGITFTNDGTVTNNGTLDNSGTLKGIGTLVQNGTFSNSATGVIAPGTSVGKLTVTGNLDLGSGTYTSEINGTVQGTSYDWLDVSGQATLTNAKLVVDWGSFTPSAGQTFTVMTFGSRVGTFNSVTIPSVSGLILTPTYTSTEMMVNAAVLPVEMVSFEAKPEDEGILLFWRTASEANNLGFHIERSTDGIRWAEIGFVPGNGTSAEPHDYSFLDKTPHALLGGGSADNYYRLRQMDYDGHSEYSSVVSIVFQLSGDSPYIFPNPTTGSFQLIGEEIEEVQVLDKMGRLLLQVKAPGHSLDVSDVPAGTYFLRMTQGGRVSMVRAVKE